ncbi:hypothetical protein A9Q84_15275 [Halobacteriovorax marinus]|uniref:DUF309 domain-containing protein n=1 Tax=Halobacteriovorax marinus TaxID=97084 RepID=A0A1Y5F5L6_9BACT|nr:hypothetical protein A9Q84_15275 [Halobacteriovorax marinus]
MPEMDLPIYAFIPGRSTHPNKPGGHMHGEEEPHAEPVEQDAPEENEILRFSLDLFNLEYFWESHVYLEALWNAHGRKGAIADFCKGIIMLAAAGIKLKLEQPAPGLGHLKRALELFEAIEEETDSLFLGFNLAEIISHVESEISRCEELGTIELKMTIHPKWN